MCYETKQEAYLQLVPQWLHQTPRESYVQSLKEEKDRYNLFKNFLIPFLFLFFWDPYNSNVGSAGFSLLHVGFL